MQTESPPAEDIKVEEDEVEEGEVEEGDQMDVSFPNMVHVICFEFCSCAQ